MSLATRCPTCNTVFQVNEEQLKRYSGVVRCGVCNNPFNGIDHLIGRLTTDASRPSSKAEKVPSSAASDENLPFKSAELEKSSDEEITASSSEAFSTKIDEDNGISISNDVMKEREDALKASFEKQIQSISFDLNVPSSEEAGEISATQSHDLPAREITHLPEVPVDVLSETAKKEPFLPADSIEDSDVPEIIVDPSQKISAKPAATDELVKIVKSKKKRSRLSQFLWSVGTLVLLVLLGVQGIYRYSEEIVAWWPPAEELVNSTCELLSCPVQTPAPKSPLSIKAGIPEKLENAPDQYSQNITMTNNSQDLQLWPSLVVELTDSDNKVLLRRVFEPQEYLPEEAGTAKGLQPASDIAFKIIFEFAHNSAINSRVSIANNP